MAVETPQQPEIKPLWKLEEEEGAVPITASPQVCVCVCVDVHLKSSTVVGKSDSESRFPLIVLE